MKNYVHAVRNFPWLFEAIESAMANLPDEASAMGTDYSGAFVLQRAVP